MSNPITADCAVRMNPAIVLRVMVTVKYPAVKIQTSDIIGMFPNCASTESKNIVHPPDDIKSLIHGNFFSSHPVIGASCKRFELSDFFVYNDFGCQQLLVLIRS